MGPTGTSTSYPVNPDVGHQQTVVVGGGGLPVTRLCRQRKLGLSVWGNYPAPPTLKKLLFRCLLLRRFGALFGFPSLPPPPRLPTHHSSHGPSSLIDSSRLLPSVPLGLTLRLPAAAVMGGQAAGQTCGRGSDLGWAGHLSSGSRSGLVNSLHKYFWPQT